MKYLLLITVFVSTLFGSSAHAALIFSDDFTSADSSDLNLTPGSRQSGSAGTQSWVETGNPDASISSNVLSINDGETSSANDSNIYLNYDLKAAGALLTGGGSFTISFDMAPNTKYGGFFLGNPSTRYVNVPTTDFMMLMDGNSTASVWDGGIQQHDTTAVGGTGVKSYLFTVTTDNFNFNTDFFISLELNGSPYDLNASVAGTIYNGKWDSGSSLYVGFSSRTGTTTIDNFAINSIPEPSSMLLLLTAGGTLLLLRRKRS